MRVLFIVFALLFSTLYVSAQEELSPKELKKLMKEWKKKKKRMGPDEFKELVESNEKMKSQITMMRADLEDAQNQLEAKNDEISDLKSKNKSLQARITQMQNEKPKSVPGFAVGNPNEGIVFKVQIGAFKNKDLSKFIDNNPNFSGDEDGGMKKYSIGIFRDYWEADAFKKYLREMGVKDAWIVSYKDGQRVDIKDVLEGVVEN
ncbi:Ezrin/radixin/moesin family protein [Hyphobacterium sp. CCMP332]|nr:Ezrin/radixin/moesin family protein [Hyphobacterium sp. CCMP332]